MLDLGTAREGSLSREAVLERLGDMGLYRYYLGQNVSPGMVVSSPFRKDNHPSFSIYKSRLYGKVMWKDHTTGEFGDVFDLIAMMHNTDLYGALVRINQDFDLGYMVTTHTPKRRYRTSPRLQRTVGGKGAEIEIKTLPWTPRTLAYWSRYGIESELLQFFKVFPANWVRLNGTRLWEWRDDNPIFAYLFHKDGEYTWKVYRPLAPKGSRWISNTNPSVLQGWEQLPDSHHRLIITKSLKDVIVLRALGEPSIAMQQEVSNIKLSVMEQLRLRFNDIWILQDFDYAGVVGANKVRKEYPDVKPFFIQDYKSRTNGLKDISDYREVHTPEETRSYLYERMRAWRTALA